MRLNAAAIEILLAKGLTGEDILELAWEMDGGRPAPRIPAAPANDRNVRMSSGQRRSKFAALVQRDGPCCSQCSCDHKTIWRQMGIWGDETGRYTKVNPSSNLEVDHKIPLWAGGGNEIENLWLLCVDCHKEKTAAEASQRRRA